MIEYSQHSSITAQHIAQYNEYLQHSSIFWPVLQNGWVFIYKLSGCGFESCCCHLNFWYGACFEQGVPWHSGKL